MSAASDCHARYWIGGRWRWRPLYGQPQLAAGRCTCPSSPRVYCTVYRLVPGRSARIADGAEAKGAKPRPPKLAHAELLRSKRWHGVRESVTGVYSPLVTPRLQLALAAGGTAVRIFTQRAQLLPTEACKAPPRCIGIGMGGSLILHSPSTENGDYGGAPCRLPVAMAARWLLRNKQN